MMDAYEVHIMNLNDKEDNHEDLVDRADFILAASADARLTSRCECDPVRGNFRGALDRENL